MWTPVCFKWTTLGYKKMGSNKKDLLPKFLVKKGKKVQQLTIKETVVFNRHLGANLSEWNNNKGHRLQIHSSRHGPPQGSFIIITKKLYFFPAAFSLQKKLAERPQWYWWGRHYCTKNALGTKVCLLRTCIRRYWKTFNGCNFPENNSVYSKCSLFTLWSETE